MTGLHLADKSALEQRRHSTAARDLLALLLVEGALASCHVTASKCSIRHETARTMRRCART